MEYLGHYDAETGREQLLKEHLDHVASLAAQFAAAFDAEELGEIAGRYNDIGKFQLDFKLICVESGVLVATIRPEVPSFFIKRDSHCSV